MSEKELLVQLRQTYHRRICSSILHIDGNGYPNFADKSSASSVAIAVKLAELLDYPKRPSPISGQRAGRLFEEENKRFLERAFEMLVHLCPAGWVFQTGVAISTFDQYAHLAEVEQILMEYPNLKTVFGSEYFIKPDIIVAKCPVEDEKINAHQHVVSSSHSQLAAYTPLRKRNHPDTPRLILHASISCKWTLRSDRAQNIRTEALMLIRNRKGHTPHIAVITAEPLPTRIASLALGTGDIDCVYHMALPELLQAIEEKANEDQAEMAHTLVENCRLRDISDLPFDLIL